MTFFFIVLVCWIIILFVCLATSWLHRNRQNFGNKTNEKKIRKCQIQIFSFDFQNQNIFNQALKQESSTTKKKVRGQIYGNVFINIFGIPNQPTNQPPISFVYQIHCCCCCCCMFHHPLNSTDFNYEQTEYLQNILVVLIN